MKDGTILILAAMFLVAVLVVGGGVTGEALRLTKPVSYLGFECKTFSNLAMESPGSEGQTGAQFCRTKGYNTCISTFENIDQQIHSSKDCSGGITGIFDDVRLKDCNYKITFKTFNSCAETYSGSFSYNERSRNADVACCNF